MSIRLGVDVGGTFTKAIAIGHDDGAGGYRLLAQAVTPTTHAAEEGVARGIVETLSQLLARPDIDADQVTLVAHSTTQAVNALLEGDTAVVGIVGMGGGRDAADALRRTQMGDIELAPQRFLRTRSVFLESSDGVSAEDAAAAVDDLLDQGAEVIVASEAFAVDDPVNERRVLEAAAARGVPALAGHQLSGVYGLEIRTLTAAINASLVPKMLQTAELVEASLRRAHIAAPLMIMRGDGGLTDLDTLRRRPILTLFSGPAASLAGALLSGGLVNGVFLEVGGTSSNLGIVRGGQPETRYVWVMDHPTCVRSLDVRVQGIAGGSMPRSDGRKIVDVGPRSAHIAGLSYASLSPELLDAGQLQLEMFAPRPGDPADYVAIRSENGRRWALTVTCAANALGQVPADAYAGGSQPAALAAFAVLGRQLGCAAQDAAQQMLDLAADRVAQALEGATREYGLRRGAFQIVGGGGGAGALVPAVAARLGVPFQLVDQAAVISSLGDALASVRETVERSLSESISADALANEAEAAAVRSGADPTQVQVVIERDEERGILRAVATGNLPLAASLAQVDVSEVEARTVAAQSANVPLDEIALLAESGGFRIYQTGKKLLRRPQTLALDRRGVVRLQKGGAQVVTGPRDEVLAQLPGLAKVGVFGGAPIVHLIVDNRLLDLTASAANKDVVGAARSAVADVAADVSITVIVER